MLNLGFLLGTLVALVAGPALLGLVQGRPAARRWVETIILVAITLLVLIEVAPYTYRNGGLVSLLFLAVGLGGPSLLELGFRGAQRQTHIGALALAMAGLVLHTVADGALLASDMDSNGEIALAAAVVLHTLPVSMAVWWLLAPTFGTRWPAAVLVAMAVGTVAGVYFGINLEQMLGARVWAWFQAFMGGLILHVVFGRPHLVHPTK